MKDTRFGPNGWTPERLASLEGRTCVITGANAGAGFQAARILLSKGANVVMLNRSAERSTAAVKELKKEFGAGADVRFVRMDLAELASVRTAAGEVLRTVPRIDALICNAAIAQVPARKRRLTGSKASSGPITTVTSSCAECSSTASRSREAGSWSSPVSATGWG